MFLGFILLLSDFYLQLDQLPLHINFQCRVHWLVLLGQSFIPATINNNQRLSRPATAISTQLLWYHSALCFKYIEFKLDPMFVKTFHKKRFLWLTQGIEWLWLWSLVKEKASNEGTWLARCETNKLVLLWNLYPAALWRMLVYTLISQRDIFPNPLTNRPAALAQTFQRTGWNRPTGHISGDHYAPLWLSTLARFPSLSSQVWMERGKKNMCSMSMWSQSTSFYMLDVLFSKLL